MVAIGSAGNDGQRVAAYPAALSNVIGVASVNDADVLSTFSNFGEDFYWIAAPGEGIVTTDPLGTYRAACGTSFSATGPGFESPYRYQPPNLTRLNHLAS